MSTCPGSKGWQMSYVSKILTNRAVVGEYQPHTKTGGRRVPVGEPISDYFPAVCESACKTDPLSRGIGVQF